VVDLAEPKPEDVVLDIATGAGHTALALSPYVTEVNAYDMTEPMFAESSYWMLSKWGGATRWKLGLPALDHIQSLGRATSPARMGFHSM
jgi:hypothetical protein